PQVGGRTRPDTEEAARGPRPARPGWDAEAVRRLPFGSPLAPRAVFRPDRSRSERTTLKPRRATGVTPVVFVRSLDCGRPTSIPGDAMTAKEVVRTSLDMDLQLLGMLLADLSDADLLVRPVPGANHIAWQMGHYLVAETSFQAAVGGPSYELP